jgi:hypothetical protein
MQRNENNEVLHLQRQKKDKKELESIRFKNAVNVASNGERFTPAANLKTYIPSKINKKKYTG